MNRRPRILDLFCGAGGAAMGYHRAGFDVVGVDIRPQPNYPFEFVQIDALDALRALLAQGLVVPRGFEGSGAYLLGDFTAVHASVPCQRYSSMTIVRGRRDDHPQLIEPTRELLVEVGLPYVIENVPRAPLIDPIQLCGSMFDLAIPEGVLRRHRLFECNFPIDAPPRCRHPRDGTKTLGIYGGGTRQTTRPKIRDERGWLVGGTPCKANAEQARQLMQMPWATRAEICQAIPPAYTEWIGRRLMSTIVDTGAAEALAA